MPARGWKRMFAGAAGFEGKGNYPIAAYSEYMPPPRLGLEPYTGRNAGFFDEADPFGWPVTEYEEAWELRPGMESIAHQVFGALNHLVLGEPAHGISAGKLESNPYWPDDLATQPRSLEHERMVVLLPLALSRTQDDKGRVRWTLFGASEQGPERAFWQGFYTAPGREMPADKALGFFRHLLAAAYDKPPEALTDLHRAGFRILRTTGDFARGIWPDSPLPSWTASYLWTAGQSLDEVKYLLTFEPFRDLPLEVRRSYLAGRLNLLPFPGSLLFWGALPYRRLQQELSFALQIPLLHSIARHEGPHGMRVPQSGWMHEPKPGAEEPAGMQSPFSNTYIRTHRWARVHRHEDEIAVLDREDKLAHVLFSTESKDVELYGKPMARNAQIWSPDHHLLLDGPLATGADIQRAFEATSKGGLFGYRFQFPAMRVGEYEVYWQRPLVAYLSRDTGKPELLDDAPTGYLTSYPIKNAGLRKPVELWPRLLRRDEHLDAIQLFVPGGDAHPYQTALNVRKLFDAAHLLHPVPLPRTYAGRLLTCGTHTSLDEWLESLPAQASDPERCRTLRAKIAGLLETPSTPRAGIRGRKPPESRTFAYSARRRFEVQYWETIRALARGEFINKCNADCIQDQVTRRMLRHHRRDLEALGDFLLAHYARVISACGLAGKALAGELPFSWKTDFSYEWYGGWRANQEGHTYERNLLMLIPGRDRRRAVILADHYDTAYMEDVYDTARGGSGARIAAAGADDNHSATAALMLAAPILCRLSREGRLGCDIWLVHLTGEEFPSDCMGARQLAAALVERSLRLRLPGGKSRDLSRVTIEGVYVMDMIAHNNDHERDVFQVAPGTGAASAQLAYHAHRSNEAWNESQRIWNQRASRRGRTRGIRSPDGMTIPGIALHPELRGEIRPHYSPRSTLFNTDGQIFSDAGIPVVLFMENYDINRTGYHDSHDTMENIDLDYGSAVAAIAIETVALAASQ